MTPEDNELLMEYLNSMGELEPSRMRIARSRARADELRKAKTGGLQNTGRFMVGPTALEHIATILSQQAGRQQQEQSDSDEDVYTRAKLEASKEYQRRIKEAAAQRNAPLPGDFGQGPLGTGDLGGMPLPEGMGGMPGQMPMPGQQPFPGLKPAPQIPGMIEDPYGVAGGAF